MVLYDLFRILRRVFHHRDWLVFCEDVCFFVLAGMLTWQYLLENCRGELRAFVFAAELIGALLWFFLCAEVFTAFGVRLVACIRFLVRLVILRPLSVLLRGVRFLLHGVLRLIWMAVVRLGVQKAIDQTKKLRITFQNAKNHLQDSAFSVYNSFVGLIMPFGRKAEHSEQEAERGAESFFPSDR